MVRESDTLLRLGSNNYLLLKKFNLPNVDTSFMLWLVGGNTFHCLRRHCDILGRMVRERVTHRCCCWEATVIHHMLLKSFTTFICYMLLKSLNAVSADTSYLPWPIWESIIGERDGSNSHLLQVAEKFGNFYLLCFGVFLFIIFINVYDMRQEKGSLVGQSCCSNAWRCLMLDRPRAIVFERPLCPCWSYLSLLPDTGPPPPPYLDPPKLPPLNNNRDPHS